MEPDITVNKRPSRITLAVLSTPYKVLATCIIGTLAFGMLGALGQIIVHDIIPTFYTIVESKEGRAHTDMTKEPRVRGCRIRLPQPKTDGE